MAILSVTGVSNSSIRNTKANLDKAAAAKFGEYYHGGLLNSEAMRNGGDTIEISNSGNVKSKMQKLQDTFANKDFSAMKPEEILKTIDKEYNRTFPNFIANASLNPELYGEVAAQRKELLKTAFGIEKNQDFDNKMIETYKKINGYEDMNAMDIQANINKKYPDDGTHLRKTQIMNEKVNAGLMSEEECHQGVKNLQFDLDRKYCIQAKIPNIEFANQDDYAKWKYKYYQGDFEKEKAKFPPAEELTMEMLTGFGEYLLEMQPLIDDFMKITDNKPADDLSNKEEEEEKKTVDKPNLDNPGKV